MLAEVKSVAKECSIAAAIILNLFWNASCSLSGECRIAADSPFVGICSARFAERAIADPCATVDLHHHCLNTTTTELLLFKLI